MSGRKRSSRTVLPWLTARSDGKEGRFIQVGNSLLLDKRVQKLSGNALRLYLCMAMESGGRTALSRLSWTASPRTAAIRRAV